MWDISGKDLTLRSATARATLRLSREAFDAVRNGTAPKGDPIPVAKVAAIQAAKNTSAILPYCHPLPLEHIAVEFQLRPPVGENPPGRAAQIVITTTVKALYKTGVEMEALTAASVAALTLYDMLKQVDPNMEVAEVVLLEKTGGKSDIRRPAEEVGA